MKFLFYVIWLLILSIGPYTLIKNSSLSLLSDKSYLINFTQRLAGLTGFTLIFMQIILGAYMTKLTEKLGSWVLKFHTTEGIFAYLFILLHPLLFVFLNFNLRGKLDPFYVFTDICLICDTRIELFYTLGRIAFWFLTIAFLAAKFREHPILRNNWRKFHILNYFAFIFVGLHALNVGSDTKTFPFSWFFWFAFVAVNLIIIHKLVVPFFKKYLVLKKSQGKVPTSNFQR